jgi:hypothetical protein
MGQTTSMIRRKNSRSKPLLHATTCTRRGRMDTSFRIWWLLMKVYESQCVEYIYGGYSDPTDTRQEDDSYTLRFTDLRLFQSHRAPRRKS